MNAADRHARASALFLAALDIAVEDRAAWLDAHATEPGIREAAVSMLNAHEAPRAAFFETPLFDRTPTDRLIGQTVQGWTLTDRLGRGGMGSVYRAHRADETFDQVAALKVVRPGFEHDFGARFFRERALLASLNHPGIARLLDGGVTADGVPYLAMELVEGEPITAYAKTRQLDVAARLGLFLLACDTVAYAHRSLVVHRDLKPAHIVVTEASGAPRVKLLDFGVAKLLEASDEQLTQTGAGPMTPAYAAPEQILQRPVTTATDVYALGVVLYELLTGHRPYHLSDLTAAQIERLVCETDPPPPSEIAEPQTARRLTGDLDAIVLRAVAKEPERRYPSAEALANDIQRHLDGLPVEARPPTARYRLGRFLRRHRAGVATVASVFALITAVVGVYTVRLEAERDRAQQAAVLAANEAERAETVAGFLEQILRAPNTRWYNDAEAKGPDTPVRAVLDEAAARLDRDFADQPDLRADLHHVLGDTYLALGLGDEAATHHRTVLALREGLYAPPHPKLAEALYYAAAYLDPGDVLTELEALDRAAAMLQVRPEGNNLPFIAQELADFYLVLGRPDTARARALEGVRFAETHFVPGHDGFRYRDVILLSLSRELTHAALDLHDTATATRWIRASDSLMALVPMNVVHDRLQTEVRGRWLAHLGRWAEAEPLLQAARGDAVLRAGARAVLEDARPARIGLELVSLYDATGRSALADAQRRSLTRHVASRDSLRQAYATRTAKPR